LKIDNFKNLATVITNLISAIPYIGNDLVVSTNNIELLSSLTIIGNISPHAIKKNPNYPNINEIPYSFISMLVGFIDGDGYISIIKSAKGFITIKLEIRLELKDILLLEYFKSILKIGTIYSYPKHNVCVYIINRTDLQSFLFPLLLYHKIKFLTNTRYLQFNKAMYILHNNIKLFSLIPNGIPEY
jgi:hypothetical protein